MKHVKHMLVAVLTVFLAAVLAVPAFAANGTITVDNAAKGETYAVYKILDATINASGGIDYTGTIPEALKNYLETTSVGTAPNTYSAIKMKTDVTKEQLFNALKDYVAKTVEGKESWDALVEGKTFTKATSSQTATGNSVSFSVDPGYYVVVSTQGTTVMVDSATNPEATIVEKNITETNAVKTVEHESYSIGDTVKYTATFNTANYLKKEGATQAQPVTSYVISDTLPPFLSNATVTSITIGGTEYKVEGAVPQFDNNNTITIPWATYDSTTGTWTSIYNNGVQIVVNYEATLTSTSNIGKNDVNTVGIQPKLGKDDGTEEEPTELKKTDDAEIKTYAAALKKTDGSKALAGAEFQVKGLIATEKEAGSGIWIVSSYDPDSNATPTTLKTDANGQLYIVGLASDADLELTETKAPDGYNKLQGTKTLEPQLMETTSSKTTTWEKYDAKGNLIDSKTEETAEYTQNIKSLADLDAAALEIVNNKGTELPSTGGMGTTILYTVGGIMVIAGIVMFLTKRRMASIEK